MTISNGNSQSIFKLMSNLYEPDSHHTCVLSCTECKSKFGSNENYYHKCGAIIDHRYSHPRVIIFSLISLSIIYSLLTGMIWFHFERIKHYLPIYLYVIIFPLVASGTGIGALGMYQKNPNSNNFVKYIIVLVTFSTVITFLFSIVDYNNIKNLIDIPTFGKLVFDFQLI